jgi:PAS domain S-box-containing protein
MWTTLKQQFWQWRGVWIIAPNIAGIVILLRLAGALQLLELVAFDQLFRLRSAESADPRIVIVTIDEADIKQLGRWPMSDRDLARLITALKQQQPRVIGLDLFRNLPVEPGHQELVQVFASTPNLIGIQQVVKGADNDAVAASPVLKERGQVSASDFVLDVDGKVRRDLLYLSGDDQQPILGLGTRLAFVYLEATGITPQPLSDRQFRLGKAVFTPFQPHDGGYNGEDAGGYQILSNFRNLPQGFHSISITDVLQGRMPPNFVRESGDAPLRDCIVLIGLTAESLTDRFYISYTTNPDTAPSGVEIHAHVASQLLSVALDGQPLLQVWSEPVEWLWILSWSGMGAILGWRLRSPWQTAIASVLASLALGGIVYLAFLAGWWLVIVPPLFALIGSAISSSSYLLWSNLNLSHQQLADYARTLEQKVRMRTRELEQEIEERQRIEVALRQSEAKFRRLAESNVIGVIVVDLSGPILEANDAFLALVGYTQEDLAAGRVNWRTMTPPEYLQVSQAAIQELKTQGVCKPYEKEYWHQDGSRIPVLIGYATLADKPDQVIGFVLDLRDRKQAEAASILEERNRMAREIHDTLAQAFTSIIVHLNAAAQRLSIDPAAAQDYIKTGRSLAKSGLADARRSMEALRPHLLEEGTLQNALKHHATQLFAHTSTAIVCEVAGQPYPLLQEVETNLLRIGQEALTNAFKYANASEIHVDLVYARPQCVLRIRDNGQGFERSQIGVGQGFGLLSMTERAERIGAKLMIQSNPGQGTEVVVRVGM